ncbi:MAG TPA: hybrid sensor histidine kinase/response regulator, partial [Chloroflexota bacterium]|nr:hybrid sensor histidine kinase/response regulator [Chloroflexota bacterium]
AVAIVVLHQPLIAVAGGLIALAAVVLAGGWGGTVVGLAFTLLIGWLTPTPAGAAAILLAWACAGVTWLGTRSFHTVVDWEQHSADLARRRTEEAQHRQGELAQMSQSLREAYANLQRANAELERARGAADEARRLKVEFATTVSHELRTPLNLIIGFGELMVLSPQVYGDAVLPAAYRGDVEAIYRNACHLSNLIDDVLDLSQVDARRMALQLEPTAIHEVITEATAAVHGLFADKRLQLAIDCPAALPSLVADPVRIRQVLINLLANAARFTDYGGVTVSARTIDGAVQVAVADTGRGMSDQEMHHIFSEFHQSGGSQQRHSSGLGLAICKRLVELHGGQISVESRLGTGTTFTFRLPTLAIDPHVGGSRWDTWVRARGGPSPPSLAVVTDDSDLLRTLRRHLEGYEVRRAPSLDAALQLADAGQARAVLLTNEDEGYDLTASLSGRDVPVFSCSFRTNQAAARTLGAAAYLAKPITQAGLHAGLAALGLPIRRMLVVDDDPEMVRLLRQMLRAEQPEMEVWPAGGGAEALALLTQDHPDAILLDLLMPDLDGYAVLERLRSDPLLREIPVVIVSAKGNASDRIVARRVAVTRADGLSLDEALRLLEASLASLWGSRNEQTGTTAD